MIELLIVLAGLALTVAMSVMAVIASALVVLFKRLFSESPPQRNSVWLPSAIARVTKLVMQGRATWVKNIRDWPILTLTCIAVGSCGFWSFLAAIAIFLDKPTTLFFGLGVGFIILGLGCFGLVYGLWKRRVWARQAVMTMSVINLTANLFMLVQLSRPILHVGNWVALFPIAFVFLVFWYFGRPDVRLAFTRKSTRSAELILG